MVLTGLMLMASTTLTAVIGLTFQCFGSIDVHLVCHVLTGSSSSSSLSLSSSSSLPSPSSSLSPPLPDSENFEEASVLDSSSSEVAFDLWCLFGHLWSFLPFWCVIWLFLTFLSFFSAWCFCLCSLPAISKGFGGRVVVGGEESMPEHEGPAIVFPSLGAFSGKACAHCSSTAIVYKKLCMIKIKEDSL